MRLTTIGLIVARVRPQAAPGIASPCRRAPGALRLPGLRGLTVEADNNDTWNAVGQMLVRTPGVAYEGRAQMLGLYSIRYRGEALMMLTRALPLSDTIRKITTEVSVTTTQGKVMHSEAAAELLALLARELPAEIESVKARFATEKKAKEKPKARKKKKSKK